MGKETIPELTIEGLQAQNEKLTAKVAELNASLKEEKKANAELTTKVAELNSSLENGACVNAELSAKVDELTDSLTAQEVVVTELMAKLQTTEHALETGEVIVESGGQQYKVIGKNLPTLSQAGTIGAKSIPSQDAAKYPEVIAELIAIGSGFLQPVTD